MYCSPKRPDNVVHLVFLNPQLDLTDASGRQTIDLEEEHPDTRTGAAEYNFQPPMLTADDTRTVSLVPKA